MGSRKGPAALPSPEYISVGDLVTAASTHAVETLRISGVTDPFVVTGVSDDYVTFTSAIYGTQFLGIGQVALHQKVKPLLGYDIERLKYQVKEIQDWIAELEEDWYVLPPSKQGMTLAEMEDLIERSYEYKK